MYGHAGCTFSTTHGVDLPLDYVSGSGTGSCSFLQWLLRRQQKVSIFYMHFAYYSSTVGTFTTGVKDNKLSRCYNTVETKFFLDFFLLFDGRIRIRRSQHLEIFGKPLSRRYNLPNGMEGHLYIMYVTPPPPDCIETTPSVTFHLSTHPSQNSILQYVRISKRSSRQTSSFRRRWETTNSS